MTRFWISLNQGVDFVIRSFERMFGGEIFIPKIPSINIVDLANAMAPNMKQKVIGIRPGEKIHEIMCPSDDSHLTIEFSNHYVIKPSIRFLDENNFLIDRKKEEGKLVEQGFEYNSGTNKHFLNQDEILKYDSWSKN